ncbi:AraC-like DNA-binding protein [Paenibacillus forsythiae]|uniref:AraC-like DNA-binding protein n=1 Tax=Paenibacillus forsythiae TaxID=365616 RepID=A0ABU3H730_9BACL|nr:AraC family transcriptional regulator [Paenibacillus forsythiae]MDT3425852.1 AraC-like DNA-binding protein [Paenibacillus forsythiae]
MESWGFGRKPQLYELKDIRRLYALLEEMWLHAGPDFDKWKSAELFLAFCVELNKQVLNSADRGQGYTEKENRDPDSAAGRITRFLHDHMERNFTLSELASYVGYSPKQTDRLFRQELGVTPHQYLQRIRLRSAALLLEEHPAITVRQAAAHIGMEPVYFARLFRREFGVVPSEYGTRGTSGS